MVFTQISKYEKKRKNHPKLNNNKIPFIIANFGE
jgi:hypothetical protein